MTLAFTLELAARLAPVCGVDEAGRGPWAGPVVAAAVIFSDYVPIEGLNDSKQVAASRRIILYEQIMAQCSVGVGQVSAEEIDRMNIWRATELAMQRAVAALPVAAAFALIDGNRIPACLPCPSSAIIRGDSISPSIAAASIIAKVTRDQIMTDYARHYPHYGFERHAGYGTAQHQAALAAHGICPIHRRSFAPIRALLEAETV
ncbi:MAG: ribonuclease HII [Alphaproteobacteria bacterium]|jgi:ribonuclease HII